MLMLQSNDVYDELAELDPSTGSVAFLSRSTLGESPDRFDGFFSKLEGKLLLLYCVEGTLHFRIDNTVIEITPETKVDLRREPGGRLIVIQAPRGPVVSWYYVPPVIDPPLSADYTAFVEEEHFDFCLFVFNVARDTQRRASICA